MSFWKILIYLVNYETRLESLRWYDLDNFFMRYSDKDEDNWEWMIEWIIGGDEWVYFLEPTPEPRYDPERTELREPNQVIMQRTWLIDSKWTPIYEGDIVKFNDSELHIIEFHDWCFCAVSIWWEWPENKGKVYAYRRYKEWFGVPEIIWNIREHPHLLES